MTSGTSTSVANNRKAGAHISHKGRNACHGARRALPVFMLSLFEAGSVLAMMRIPLNEADRLAVPVDANRRAFRQRFGAFVLAAHQHFAEPAVHAVQPLAAEEEAARHGGGQTSRVRRTQAQLFRTNAQRDRVADADHAFARGQLRGVAGLREVMSKV